MGETGDLWAGRRLGRYQLVRKLGQGGMGSVYLAQDTRLLRDVAVKILTTVDPSAGSEEKLLHEARAAARISHPNVVGIYEIEHADNVWFIAMELATGPSAGQSLVDQGAMDWQKASRIVLAVCKGLQAAHELGIIHRDVKPGNILLSQTGPIKLADFGLARARHVTGMGISSAGRVVGTAAYMSPEQVRGEHVDLRSDIYSLGATYYSLLTGQPPYAGEPLQVMFAHCANPVPDPRKKYPDLPEACTKIIQRAMAKQPAERYVSAAEMQQELAQLLNTVESSVDITPLVDPSTSRSALADGDSTLPLPSKPPPRRLHLPREWAPWAAVLVVTGFLAWNSWTRPPREDSVVAKTPTGEMAGTTSLPVPEPPLEADDTQPGTVNSRRPPAARRLPQRRGEGPKPAEALFDPRHFPRPNWMYHPVLAWRVENDNLVVRGGPASCLTQRKFGSYVLTVEVRFTENADGGIFLRSLQNTPTGYEVRLAKGHVGELRRGPHSAPYKAPEKETDWYTLRITVDETFFFVQVNGLPTSEHVDLGWPSVPPGRILLFSHTPGELIEFRKIQVEELPPVLKREEPQ